MKKICLSLLLYAVSICFVNAECTLSVSISNVPQPETVPVATIDYLNARLTQIASEDGIVADPTMTNFVITAKFHHILEETLPGPPIQTALHTYLTFYIGEIDSETVYHSTSIELRGIGTSAQRAFINALRTVNIRNSEIRSFFDNARRKIIDYYDANYKHLIEKAERAENQHEYELGLWILSRIPECCIGYNEASSLSLKLFQKHIDSQGSSLYTKAFALWSANPNENGATQAFQLLTMIDPESASYPKAATLAQEIKSAIKSEHDFELREKYNDSVDLERRRIESAREIGTAYGKGQQPITTNLNWIK